MTCTPNWSELPKYNLFTDITHEVLPISYGSVRNVEISFQSRYTCLSDRPEKNEPKYVLKENFKKIANNNLIKIKL